MAESDEEMDYMSEKELRIAYRKLFAMSPEMSIDYLMELLKRNDWNATKSMAELYRLREGIQEEKTTTKGPIDPLTESPARPKHLKTIKTSQEPTRRSPRRKLLSKGALTTAEGNGRARPRVSSSSPETEDRDTPEANGIILGDEDEDRHATKRQKLNTSSKTSMFSREQTSNDSIDYNARLAIIDRKEIKRALQKEDVDQSDEDEKAERHIAQIAPETKKANHTTVTPWIGRLAGGLYVKTLLVTDEFDNALKDKDGVVAEMKSKGELKSIIDMTVNREKLYKEGWRGKHVTNEIKFIGQSTWENGTRKGYGAVLVDGQKILIGDCVVIRPGEDEGAKTKKKKADGEAAAQIWFGKIMSMFHDSSVRDDDDCEQVHVRWFNHGGDSFLSETAGPRELFLLTRCDNIPLTTVAGKVQVDKITTVGPIESDERFHEVNHYFYRFHDDESDNYPSCWEDASFHEDEPGSAVKFDGEQEPCYSCNRKAQDVADSLARTAKNNATNEINRLWWGGKQYHIGDFVYIQPDNLMKPFVIGRLNKIIPTPVRSRVRRVDGEMMMEDAYDIELLNFRRHKEFSGSDYFTDATNYRPHKTRDERRLYQTAKVQKYDVERLLGKCNVVHGKNVEDLEAYKQLSDTFYVLDQIPDLADDGTSNGGKHTEDLLRPLDKSDFKDSCDANKMGNKDKARREEFSKAGRKLLAMDVFAGCGGLTHGLDAGGAVETRWAVEWDVEAAATFKKNFPHAIMYNEDVNKLLHQARKEELGAKTRPLRDRNGKIMQRMPKKGQVDFLYGGPPCQDFSGANRFRKANSIKNSLLTVYLSLLDHYRPAHFMLENVKDLLYHRLGSSQSTKHKVTGGIEQGSVKFILRALTSLGYSAQYNLMQASELGSPQSRRRVFFMGTRLGIKLPLYPQPTHVCLTVATHTRNKGISAPHGPVTIGDAISDLPQFDWGVVIPEDDTEWLKERAGHVTQARYPLDRGVAVGRMVENYAQPPISNYQAWMRSGRAEDEQVRNHYTAHYQEANLLRVLSIPMVPLANWKDAPQEYIAAGLKRRGSISRFDNRYQRLDADGAIQTCMTNMCPSGMAVIHPYCRRTLTIREMARAQSFPDWFVWEDGLDEQGRSKSRSKGMLMKPRSCIKQIGNAVSGCHGLPLGKAIFEVEYERWAKEGKPQMEPRTLNVEIKFGQGVVFGDTDVESIDDSDVEFSDPDYFEAKDESNSDDELVLAGARKAYKPDTKPVIRLNKDGGNAVFVLSDSDSEGNQPPKRRPQGTFVQGHGRPGIGRRAAASKRNLNEDKLLGPIITDSSSSADSDVEELFVDQGIGRPPHDEMDDEEFERWLVLDGGRFEDAEAAAKPARLAEIQRLERGGSGTPKASKIVESTPTAKKNGGKVGGKRPTVVLGAFIDDSDSDEMVIDVGRRKSASRASSAKKVGREEDTLGVASATKTVTSFDGSNFVAKTVPVVKIPSFAATSTETGHVEDDEDDEEVIVVGKGVVKASALKLPTLPVLSNGHGAAIQAAIVVDGGGDADEDEIAVDAQEATSDSITARKESAFKDAMQGVEADGEVLDESFKAKLASWGEARA